MNKLSFLSADNAVICMILESKDQTFDADTYSNLVSSKLLIKLKVDKIEYKVT